MIIFNNFLKKSLSIKFSDDILWQKLTGSDLLLLIIISLVSLYPVNRLIRYLDRRRYNNKTKQMSSSTKSYIITAMFYLSENLAIEIQQ